MPSDDKAFSVSDEEMLESLRKLEGNKTSKLGDATEIGGAVAVGAAVATAASAAPVTLLGSTTLGGLAATAGLVGTALSGGMLAAIGVGAAAATYGGMKLIRRFGKDDQRRADMADDIAKRIHERTENAKQKEKVALVESLMRSPLAQKRLSAEFVADMSVKLRLGGIDPDLAQRVIMAKLEAAEGGSENVAAAAPQGNPAEQQAASEVEAFLHQALVERRLPADFVIDLMGKMKSGVIPPAMAVELVKAKLEESCGDGVDVGGADAQQKNIRQ